MRAGRSGRLSMWLGRVRAESPLSAVSETTRAFYRFVRAEPSACADSKMATMATSAANLKEPVDPGHGLRSYSSQLRGPAGLVREVVGLLRAHGGDPGPAVAATLEHLRALEDFAVSTTGLPLFDLEMLDVGAGQRLMQMAYFTAHGNRVVGVDRDVIVQGLDVAGYVRMARSNGLRRVAKTAGRKLLGVDARYHAALRRELGVAADPGPLVVHQMDATELAFADETFDAVYSLTVLQYIADPARALAEMARVVRPGGIVFTQFLPFTGVIGSFDVGALGGSTSLPDWSHLRVQLAPHVREAAYLNRLRIPEWRALFEGTMPGCVFVPDDSRREELAPRARRLQEAGELREYEIDELVASEVRVAWRKPIATPDDEPPGRARP